MRIFFLRTAFISAFIAVSFGAFAAHLLQSMIEPSKVDTFNIGVRYQFYHSLALAMVGLLGNLLPEQWLRWAGRLFILGILFFSGSLYLLALREVFNISHWTWLGPLTPIGGLCFLLGWLTLFIATFRQ